MFIDLPLKIVEKLTLKTLREFCKIKSREHTSPNYNYKL